LGIGDWGLVIVDFAQSPIPNPQSPIPKEIILFNVIKIYPFNLNKYFYNIYLKVLNNNGQK